MVILAIREAVPSLCVSQLLTRMRIASGADKPKSPLCKDLARRRKDFKECQEPDLNW